MTVDLIHPDGLPRVPLYHQVSVATGTRIVSIAGQVARDADGNRIGDGDLGAQIVQAYRNVATALAAVGGAFDDVTALTMYVVDWHVDKLGQLADAMTRATAELGSSALPPATLIGVAALAEPDLLVELVATAVFD